MLLRALVASDVRHVIFSSTAAYGVPDTVPIPEEARTDPINPFGRSKIMTETMLADVAAAHPLNYCALRYFNVAGAGPARRAGQATVGATHLIKVAPDAPAFAEAPDVSIDYAVMEKTARAAMVAVDMAWSDVGSWDAVWSLLPRDADGNAQLGSGVLLDCTDSLAITAGGPPVHALGVAGLAIILSPRGILVVPRDKAQAVKAMVDRLTSGPSITS